MGRKLAGYLMASAVALVAGSFGAYAADDDFSLAMVIKSTTNPYYNATLAGAKIAAKEIGGTVENYGPTQSSAAGAGRHHQQPRRPARRRRSRSRRAIPTPSCRR